MAVVVTVVVAIGIPARATYGARTTADEPHYLLTAMSLWEDRSLDYADERAELRYWPFHAVLLPVQAERQTDGDVVAPHDPLLPAVLAAPVGLGGWVGAKLAMSLLAGVLAALTWLVLERRIGVRRSVAAAAALIAGCSPPLVIYGSQIYPELLGAIATLVGFAAVTSPTLSGRATAVAVSAVSGLPWLNVKYAPVAIVVAGALLLRLRRERSAGEMLRTGAALLGSGVLFAVLHVRWYGGLTAYASGSHFGSGELSVMGDDPDYASRSVRLLGLLVDRDFGLAAWQPIALLAPAAVVLWLRRGTGPGRWVLPAIVLAGWLTATYLALTMHGWWWPGRQTVVVVPLLVVAIAKMVDGWGPVARRVVAVVGACGVWAYAWLVGGVFAGAHTLIVDFDRTADPLGWLWRRLLPDLRADGAVDVALYAAWLVVVAVSIAWAARAGNRSVLDDVVAEPVASRRPGDRVPAG